jgi:hypothetical protein
MYCVQVQTGRCSEGENEVPAQRQSASRSQVQEAATGLWSLLIPIHSALVTAGRDARRPCLSEQE